MSIEQRLAEAVTAKVEAAEVPAVDVVALRGRALRRSRQRRSIAVAAAAAVLAGGVALWQQADSTPRPTPPASPDPAPVRDGVRAFLDPGAGLLHLGARSVELDEVRGLVDSGVAVPDGVLYQTADQEIRLIDASGDQTVLAEPLGPPPSGFRPSVAYDAESDVVVALRLTAGDLAKGRPWIEAYDATTGELIVRVQMIQMADPTAVTLAGAGNGVAALNYRSASYAGVLSWTWRENSQGSEWGRGAVFDLRNRVVLAPEGQRLDLPPRTAGVPASSGGWQLVEGQPGERLDGAGAWRVDTTWQPWPTEGPVQRSSFREDTAPLPELPRGSRFSLMYDTDGSVLVAVQSAAGFDEAVSVFDCDLGVQACEPIGGLDSVPDDPIWLDGTRP